MRSPAWSPVKTAAQRLAQSLNAEEIGGIARHPLPFIAENPFRSPITQHFTRAEEIRCQKETRAVSRARQSFMRTAGNAGLTRPIRNRWRQPPRCEKRMRLLRANGDGQFSQLFRFISTLDSTRKRDFVRPKPRIPELKQRQDRQNKRRPHCGPGFDRRKQSWQYDDKDCDEKVTPARLPNRQQKCRDK